MPVHPKKKKFVVREKPKPKGLPPSKAQKEINKKRKAFEKKQKDKPRTYRADQGIPQKIPERINSAENIMMGMKKTGTNQYYITQLEKKIKALKKRQSLNVEITSKKK